MRQIVVTNNVTLDGVMQAPGRPDEDRRGGFRHGGWAGPYNDSVKGAMMGRGMAREVVLLFGRRTYEDFYGVWPHRTDNPFTEVLNRTTKYVASTTLREPLPWENSVLLEGDAADAVARLKEEPGPDFSILGSGELIRSLRRRDLIDRYVLLVHPLTLGTGRRLFDDGDPLASFHLVESVPTTKGVIIATYERAEPGNGDGFTAGA